MRAFFISISLFLGLSASALSQEISIQVLDKNTREAIIQAHIISDAKVVAVTNLDGYFSINPGKYPHLRITAVGYSTQEVHLHPRLSVVYMSSQIQNSKELFVMADKEGEQNIHTYVNRNTARGMDAFLASIDGLAATKRGAFGWEPAIRGQSDQRMNLVIDGMQIFKACVDKMDPITSYVEANNLSRLHIDKSGTGVAQHGTGSSTVNLITQKAAATPLSLDISSAYRFPDHYRTLSLSGNIADRDGTNAIRFSGSYKKADDFVAGNNQTISNTQYEKMNLNLSYRYAFRSGHYFDVNYIADKAFDIGYPALLMDAPKALADIGQIQFNFAPSERDFRLNKIQIYANAIRHTMSDDNRDVANRPVMRGMHMPMYGTTTTYGAKAEGGFRVLHHPVDWFVDSFASQAYGDMQMISLDPSVADMFIHNLNDVNTYNIGFGLRHRFQLSDALLLKVEENVRHQSLGTGSEIYASFFEGLYGRKISYRHKWLLSASGSLLWMANDDWSISGNLVYSQRMGNHMELFGHYIYNYTDGYFYDGNPWLKTEQSVNTDINVMWKNGRHSLSLSLFHRQYFDYIDGIKADDVSNHDFQFKQYANVGDAGITGAEFRSIHTISHSLSFENRLAYLYAQNQTLGEPLPLIPPLHGNNTLHLHIKNNMLMAEIEWAAAQNRIAHISSIEDKTDGYAIVNLTYERRFMDGLLSAIVDVNNIFDHYYHTHTSIGNIASAGRSLMLSLRYQL